MERAFGNYIIQEFTNGDLRIDYKRSTKDFFYIIVYFIISIPFLLVAFKFINYLIYQDIDLNVVLSYIFSSFLILVGLYFLIGSIETLFKATNKVFNISTSKKQLQVRVNVFKRRAFIFTDIKEFNLSAKDITAVAYVRGTKYTRPLYLIYLTVELHNGQKIKIHQFEGAHLLLSAFEKQKKQSLKEISKQVTGIVSQKCGKEFYWKGIQKLP